MTDLLQHQVAFFTGLSNPHCWSLSPSQLAFLSSLCVPSNAVVPLNFPYCPLSIDYREVPILRASINNLVIYFQSRNAAFRERYKSAVMELIDRAELTFILAGSCGLEILSNLQLPPTALRHLRVFAYGAVVRNLPNCPVLLVQGRSDKLSRHLSPKAHHYVCCSHMNYLTSVEVLVLCRQFIDEQLKLHFLQRTAIS